jgi:formylglycine-generating enzyme required for sulfatase activity
MMGSAPQEIERITNDDFKKWASEQETPPHRVTLSQGYWLADTPCTQAFWQLLMGENPSHFKDESDAAQRPVESVSWDSVREFLDRLNQELPDGVQAFLPTEAQWEYAARAGTRTAYWWGDEADSSRANWNGEQKGTTPVKRYPPNAWGLHDTHGNVWEWCAGSRRPYRDHAEHDPPDGDDKTLRALRGGSWFHHPGYARAAFRDVFLRGFGWPYFGFRLALRSVSPGGGAAVLGSRSEP